MYRMIFFFNSLNYIFLFPVSLCFEFIARKKMELFPQHESKQSLCVEISIRGYICRSERLRIQLGSVPLRVQLRSVQLRIQLNTQTKNKKPKELQTINCCTNSTLILGFGDGLGTCVSSSFSLNISLFQFIQFLLHLSSFHYCFWKLINWGYLTSSSGID